MSAFAQSVIGMLHENLVSDRRAKRLAAWFAQLVPHGSRVLDVGCGDGAIAALLASQRPDIVVHGVDVLVRDNTRISVTAFEGTHLPFDARSFDLVLFSDVLHHANDPTILLVEARRVTSGHVLIKDHYVKGLAAARRLRMMDRAGNARFGVSLPYNYWREDQWSTAWREIGLRPERLVTHLGLYPVPADWIFGAHLHFIALLIRDDRFESTGTLPE